MKEEAEKKEMGNSTPKEDNKNQTESFITSKKSSSGPSPDTSPRISNSLRTMIEGLSVLEREFMEFREKTLCKLDQETSDNRVENQNHTLIFQQQDQIRELQQAVRDLEEDNQSLRMIVQILNKEVINILKTRAGLQQEGHLELGVMSPICEAPHHHHHTQCG